MLTVRIIPSNECKKFQNSIFNINGLLKQKTDSLRQHRSKDPDPFYDYRNRRFVKELETVINAWNVINEKKPENFVFNETPEDIQFYHSVISYFQAITKYYTLIIDKYITGIEPPKIELAGMETSNTQMHMINACYRSQMSHLNDHNLLSKFSYPLEEKRSELNSSKRAKF